MLVIVGVIAPLAAFAIAGPYYFNRPFWSDEVLGWLIAADPSFDHGMAALAGGVDTNAPLVHLLFRVLGQTFGTTAIVYRLASLVAMATTIAGLYLTLRRSVKASAAAFGCLCFAALPIVISHTTEARFYAFELAAAVWTNLLIARRGDSLRAGPSAVRSPGNTSGRGRPGSYLSCSAGCIALSSIALCGVHYFGVIALGCIVFADRFSHRSTTRECLGRVWPSAAGFAMTACLLPLVMAQRTAMPYAGGTWVPDTFVTNLRVLIDMLLPPAATSIAVLSMMLSVALVGCAALLETLRPHRAILMAACAYVVVLFAFDRLVQPVLIPRYFIVALPAVAAVAAAIASRWPTNVTRAAIALIAVCLCGQWWNIRTRSHAPDGRAAAGLLASVAAIDDQTPIISDWLGHAIAIIKARPANVSYFADKRLHEAGFDSAIRYEREMAACVQRFYGLPGETNLSRMNRLDRFVLLTEFPETIHERFPEYETRQLGTVAFELRRSSQHAGRGAVGSQPTATAD